MIMKARLLSEFSPGDTVKVPSGRIATVHGFPEGLVLCRFDDGDEVELHPWKLEIIQKAKPKAVRADFMKGDRPFGLRTA